MSMTFVLESISSNPVILDRTGTAGAEKQQTSIPLRIFNGACHDALADAGEFFAGDEDGCGDTLCLEKAWHGLHFLLTGDAWGGVGWHAFLLCGGAEQGTDMGYGPARHFEADEVREIDEVLADISEDDLWSRFDAEKMTAVDIYPSIWDESEEDLRDEYLAYFQMLKEFVARTAEQGAALQLSMA